MTLNDGYPDDLFVRFDSKLGKYVECAPDDSGAVELYDDGTGVNVATGALVESEMLESFDRSSVGLRKYLDVLEKLADDLFAASDALLNAAVLADNPDELAATAAARTKLANVVLAARFDLAQVC
jgi:hypothetical protein